MEREDRGISWIYTTSQRNWQGNFKGTSKGNSSDTECYNCHKKGHMQRIVGQREEAEKGRDPRARKDQIGQDVHIKLEKIL